MKTCGFIPPTPGYAACARPRDREGLIGHDGSCAHPLALDPTRDIMPRIKTLVREDSDGSARETIEQGLKMADDQELDALTISVDLLKDFLTECGDAPPDIDGMDIAANSG